GLPSGAIERDHQLSAQPLLQRMLRDELLQFGHELGMLPELEIGLDPALDRQRAKLFQASDRGLGERLVDEVGERRPAPERKRLTKFLRGALRIRIGSLR